LVDALLVGESIVSMARLRHQTASPS